jgi:phage/plasmid-like protein (TIGR03299 family)
MSHEFESGLFTNNEEAWHGLGVVMPEKVYDIQKALTVGGLDWTVSKRPLAYTANDGQDVIEMPGYYALARDSDNTILNPCVSKTYVPLQNSEAFSFFEPFLHEQDCFISAAISLQNGKKVCMTVEIEDNEREIVPGDTVKTYLLLVTSHDGSSKTIVKYTDKRPVCQNTLRMALAGSGEFRAVRHSSNQLERLQSIQSSLNLYKRSFEHQVSLYKQLANKRMDVDATRNYLETLLHRELKETGVRLEKAPEEVKLEDNRFARKCLENYLFTPDLQMPGVEGTAWAAFNSVTEAVKYRSSNPDNRLNSIWFGPDGKLIERAKELALTI